MSDIKVKPNTELTWYLPKSGQKPVKTLNKDLGFTTSLLELFFSLIIWLLKLFRYCFIFYKHFWHRCYNKPICKYSKESTTISQLQPLHLPKRIEDIMFQNQWNIVDIINTVFEDGQVKFILHYTSLNDIPIFKKCNQYFIISMFLCEHRKTFMLPLGQ